MSARSTSDRVCVGAISGAFGVRGEVRLKSFCAEPEAVFGYGPLYTEDGARSFTLRPTRALKGALGARLSGVDSKEAADALKGVTLWAERSYLPNLPDDEFYYADLIGLEAVDTGGAVLGRVAAVHNHGAGDILELRGTGPARLLPFTRAVVPTVDLSAGRLVVDPPGEAE